MYGAPTRTAGWTLPAAELTGTACSRPPSKAETFRRERDIAETLIDLGRRPFAIPELHAATRNGTPTSPGRREPAQPSSRATLPASCARSRGQAVDAFDAGRFSMPFNALTFDHSWSAALATLQSSYLEQLPHPTFTDAEQRSRFSNTHSVGLNVGKVEVRNSDTSELGSRLRRASCASERVELLRKRDNLRISATRTVPLCPEISSKRSANQRTLTTVQKDTMKGGHALSCRSPAACRRRFASRRQVRHSFATIGAVYVFSGVSTWPWAQALPLPERETNGWGTRPLGVSKSRSVTQSPLGCRRRGCTKKLGGTNRGGLPCAKPWSPP